MTEKASLREQIRIFKSTLNGDALNEFNKVYNAQSETKPIKKAFVAAKEAVAALNKVNNVR